MPAKTEHNQDRADDQWLDHLKAATPEEKQRFWKLLQDNFSSAEEQEPPYDERMVDLFFDLYATLVEKGMVPKPRNVAEMTDFWTAVLVPWKHGLSDLVSARTQSLPSPDLTARSGEEKEEFWLCLQKIFPSDKEFAGPYEEARADAVIRNMTKMLSGITCHENLNELAATLKSVSTVLTSLCDSETSSSNWMRKFLGTSSSLVELTSDEELSETCRGINLRLVENLRELKSALDTLEPIGGNTDQAMRPTQKEAFYKVWELVGLLQPRTKDIMLEGWIQTINTKLDELQKRLGSYADTQDRLEAIHGELSELKAFQEKQEEYKSVPPLPVVDQMSRTGREHLVERERVMGTVDPVLFNLFHNERNARGVTVSRMLDIVLWKYFGKPKLSFQIIDDPSPFSDSGGTSG